MVKLVDADTSDTVQENAYDAQTWRTVRRDYEAGTLAETRHYFYTAEWQDIEERLDAATTPERQHVWGLRYIDDLVLRDRAPMMTATSKNAYMRCRMPIGMSPGSRMARGTSLNDMPMGRMELCSSSAPIIQP